MPNVKPVSALHNYAAVLNDVSVGAPVFLAKNGRNAYAIVDIAEQQEYEKTKAALTLMTELARGKKSGEEQGWRSEAAVAAHFAAKFENR